MPAPAKIKVEELDKAFARAVAEEEQDMFEKARARYGVHDAKTLLRRVAQVQAIESAILRRRHYELTDPREGLRVEWLEDAGLFAQTALPVSAASGDDETLVRLAEVHQRNGGDGDYALYASRMKLAEHVPAIPTTTADGARNRRMQREALLNEFDRTWSDTVFDLASPSLRRYLNGGRRAPLVTIEPPKQVRFELLNELPKKRPGPFGAIGNFFADLFFLRAPPEPVPISVATAANHEPKHIRPTLSHIVDKGIHRIQNQLGAGTLSEQDIYRAQSLETFANHVNMHLYDNRESSVIARSDIDLVRRLQQTFQNPRDPQPSDVLPVLDKTLADLAEPIKAVFLPPGMTTAVGADITRVTGFIYDVLKTYGLHVGRLRTHKDRDKYFTSVFGASAWSFVWVKPEYRRSEMTSNGSVQIWLPNKELALLGALAGSYEMLLLFIKLRLAETPREAIEREKDPFWPNFTKGGYTKMMEEIVSVAAACAGRDWLLPMDSITIGTYYDQMTALGEFYDPKSGRYLRKTIEETLKKYAPDPALRTSATPDFAAGTYGRYLFTEKMGATVKPGRWPVEKRRSGWLYRYSRRVIIETGTTATLFLGLAFGHYVVNEYLGFGQTMAILGAGVSILSQVAAYDLAIGAYYGIKPLQREGREGVFERRVPYLSGRATPTDYKGTSTEKYHLQWVEQFQVASAQGTVQTLMTSLIGSSSIRNETAVSGPLDAVHSEVRQVARETSEEIGLIIKRQVAMKRGDKNYAYADSIIDQEDSMRMRSLYAAVNRTVNETKLYAEENYRELYNTLEFFWRDELVSDGKGPQLPSAEILANGTKALRLITALSPQRAVKVLAAIKSISGSEAALIERFPKDMQAQAAVVMKQSRIVGFIIQAANRTDLNITAPANSSFVDSIVATIANNYRLPYTQLAEHMHARVNTTSTGADGASLSIDPIRKELVVLTQNKSIGLFGNYLIATDIKVSNVSIAVPNAVPASAGIIFRAGYVAYLREHGQTTTMYYPATQMAASISPLMQIGGMLFRDYYKDLYHAKTADRIGTRYNFDALCRVLGTLSWDPTERMQTVDVVAKFLKRARDKEWFRERVVDFLHVDPYLQLPIVFLGAGVLAAFRRGCANRGKTILQNYAVDIPDIVDKSSPRVFWDLFRRRPGLAVHVGLAWFLGQLSMLLETRFLYGNWIASVAIPYGIYGAYLLTLLMVQRNLLHGWLQTPFIGGIVQAVANSSLDMFSNTSYFSSWVSPTLGLDAMVPTTSGDLTFWCIVIPTVVGAILNLTLIISQFKHFRLANKASWLKCLYYAVRTNVPFSLRQAQTFHNEIFGPLDEDKLALVRAFNDQADATPVEGRQGPGARDTARDFADVEGAKR